MSLFGKRQPARARLRRARLRRWTIELEMSSGRVARVTWHPNNSGLDKIQPGGSLVKGPTGYLLVDGDLTEGEAWELKQRLSPEGFPPVLRDPMKASA